MQNNVLWPNAPPTPPPRLLNMLRTAVSIFFFKKTFMLFNLSQKGQIQLHKFEVSAFYFLDSISTGLNPRIPYRT
jgi:hypothetical protein